MIQFGNVQSSIPEERLYRIRLLGAGAANPTVQIGQGVTVARTATGVYKISFIAGPGTFIGLVGAPTFGAATPADVKGQTCTRSPYTDQTATALGFFTISVWSSTFAADDLQATETLDLTVAFTENSEVA